MMQIDPRTVSELSTKATILAGFEQIILMVKQSNPKVIVSSIQWWGLTGSTLATRATTVVVQK